MILEMATTMLETLGYTVLPAAGPDEAICLAGEQNGTIDLLMTDVVMPVMNGRLLAHHLRGQFPACAACSCRATRPTLSPTTACWTKACALSKNRSPCMPLPPKSVLAADRD